MRFLFISYICPGVFGPMASWLGASQENQVIFAASRADTEQPLAGVQRVLVKKIRGARNPDAGYFDLWQDAINAGKNAGVSWRMLRDSGFVPDIIFNASVNGISLAVKSTFPNAFIVNFLEQDNWRQASHKQMQLELQYIQILESDLTYAFSEKCADLYPEPLKRLIRRVPPMVGLALPHQDTIANDAILVVCSGQEETCWRLCTELLALAPGCQVILLARNSFAARKLEKLGIPEPLASRFLLRVARGRSTLRELLSSASLAVIPQAAHGLLDCLSAGVPVFICQNELPGELASYVVTLPQGSPKIQALAIIRAMGNLTDLKKMATAAAAKVDEKFSIARVMPAFMSEILAAKDGNNPNSPGLADLDI